MKKRIVSLLLICVLLLALGLSAGAADIVTEGFTDVAVADAFADAVSVVPLKADGSAAELVGGVYVDAVKLQVTYSDAVPSCYYMVLALTSENGVPTENNILYLDQVTAQGEVSFTVYPRAMADGETGYIYLSSNADTGVGGLTKVASFTYTSVSVTYRLGDVDGNSFISSNDAVWVMNAAAENIQLDAAQTLAADVNLDGSVDATDALFILQAVVHLRTIP